MFEYSKAIYDKLDQIDNSSNNDSLMLQLNNDAIASNEIGDDNKALVKTEDEDMPLVNPDGDIFMIYSDNEDGIMMGADDGDILMTAPYDENAQLIDMNAEDIHSRLRKNMRSNYRDGAQEYNRYYNNNILINKIIKNYNNNKINQPDKNNLLEEGELIYHVYL